MAAWCDRWPDFPNYAVGADPICHPHDPEKGFSEKAFHSPGFVGSDDVKASVRKKRKIQAVFGFEFGLRFHGISAATHDCGVNTLEIVHGFRELDGFVRAAGGIGFRIKIENEISPAIIRERDCFAVIGDYAEAGGLIAFF